jgi:hypothetical protein
VSVLASLRCHYCSRWRAAWDVHRLGTPEKPAQLICMNCLDWHQRALDLLAGHAMPGCQECCATWATLRDQAPGVEVRLYVVPRDGIYQVLCASCVGPYVRARRDLYVGTPFAHAGLEVSK